MGASQKFRRHWDLKSGTVFLNHGSFGACPRPVLRAQAELRRLMEAEPVQFLWRRYEERLQPSRKALAAFIGARPRDVAFVTNATTGVNAVVRSLRWRRGDEILTTDHNYNACHNVLLEMAHRTGAKVTVAHVPFPCRGEDEVMEAILRRVTARTRLAMIDHVTSNTALVFPIRRIVRELETRGVDTLVDGAHAPGMVPLSMRHLRPAYYTANLHKWVCAPKGAAFLWVREDRQEGIQPAVISHGNNRARRGFTRFQDRFDWPGTFDPTAWMCAGDAIGWMENLLPGGWPELRKRNHELAVQARRLLCDRLNVAPPCPESMLGFMATIPLPDAWQSKPPSGKIDDDQLRLYDQFGIEVPFNRLETDKKRYFRISAQVYNRIGDYEVLARALKELDAHGDASQARRSSRGDG